MKYGLLLLSLGFIACQKDPPAPPMNEKTMKDVAYGTDPMQKMDIYLPSARNTTSTRVMILVHGGAWSSGDKTDFNLYVDSLKRRLPDYAIFNINYRLSANSLNTFPTQENDTRAAIEFVHAHREEYGISNRFVLLGASAGAHLALLHAYKYTSPVKIKAVIDFFGPTDMIDLYNNPASIFIPPSAVAGIVGATPSSNLALYQQSSPVTFVNAQTPPTIILQGGMDPLVSVAQATTLKTKLQQAGVVHEYVFYPMEGHGWVGVNLVHSFDKIQAFLVANVN